MPPVAAALLILSALIHALWNLISKRDHPTLAYFLAANNFGVLFVIPFVLPFWDLVIILPPLVWTCILCSGFFLTVYMAGLAGAYQAGDMSIAYPLARALPVLFVTAATWILDLGKPVSIGFLAGAILVVIGCFMLPMRPGYRFKLRNYINVSCMMAVLAAAGISGYTMVDHEALRYLRNLPATPFSSVTATLVYMALEAVSCSFWMMIFVLMRGSERRYFKEVMDRYKISAALTGGGIYLTYGLVLLAMNYVSNVSYVAAFRQLSIPLGAVLGMAVLREPAYSVKIFGILVVFSGLVLVGLLD